MTKFTASSGLDFAVIALGSLAVAGVWHFAALVMEALQ